MCIRDRCELELLFINDQDGYGLCSSIQHLLLLCLTLLQLASQKIEDHKYDCSDRQKYQQYI